nr:hypothetical protein [Cytophagales bacterium]
MMQFFKHIVFALAGLTASIPLFTEPNLFLDTDLENRELVKQVETDSIRYELWRIDADNGTPEQYMAEIFTPVCYSNKCYPVFINFYWDLLGNFQYFEMPQGKTLTKLDHLPFEPEDYKKMQKILANTSSLLKDYKAEDLVVSTESDLPYGVDAVTGATSKTIQNEVISGAVYSCYTLWHLAHGDIASYIAALTEENVDDLLLISFLESTNYHYQYWAIDKVLTANRWDEAKFETPLLQIIRGDNLFVAEHVLETMPDKVWKKASTQHWLWESYLSAPYRLQLKILDKLQRIDLDPSLHFPLAAQLEHANQEQKKRIFLVLAQESTLTKEAQQALIPYLTDSKWRGIAHGILSSQRKPEKNVTAAISQLKEGTN